MNGHVESLFAVISFTLLSRCMFECRSVVMDFEEYVQPTLLWNAYRRIDRGIEGDGLSTKYCGIETDMAHSCNLLDDACWDHIARHLNISSCSMRQKVKTANFAIVDVKSSSCDVPCEYDVVDDDFKCNKAVCIPPNSDTNVGIINKVTKEYEFSGNIGQLQSDYRQYFPSSYAMSSDYLKPLSEYTMLPYLDRADNNIKFLPLIMTHNVSHVSRSKRESYNANRNDRVVDLRRQLIPAYLFASGDEENTYNAIDEISGDHQCDDYIANIANLVDATDEVDVYVILSATLVYRFEYPTPDVKPTRIVYSAQIYDNYNVTYASTCVIE
ncbi:hypothetical protein [Heliothis virescens ascovirus 3j]|uniref:Uncharacterized protein n=1 Tax=Heliothis virescens ascovirus 3j TaxID=1561067 RepID=A0A2Z5UZB4_9VIRU|nr:hypothetical protein [Heliothis virescens ascovirus 3j]